MSCNIANCSSASVVSMPAIAVVLLASLSAIANVIAHHYHITIHLSNLCPSDDVRQSNVRLMFFQLVSDFCPTSIKLPSTDFCPTISIHELLFNDFRPVTFIHKLPSIDFHARTPVHKLPSTNFHPQIFIHELPSTDVHPSMFIFDTVLFKPYLVLYIATKFWGMGQHNVLG